MTAGNDNHQRLLETLQLLLELPTTEFRSTLAAAADLIAAATQADKVDAFLHDPGRDSLVALGTSSQPLSVEQKRRGLDVLPIANGGRAVEVFNTGKTYVSGDVENDSGELVGIKEALGIRSAIGVYLAVGNVRRGMLMLASQKPDFFGALDVRFVENVARWIGIVAHRAELAERTTSAAAEQGRRAGAEELVTVLAHDLRNYLGPLEIRLRGLHQRAQDDGRDIDQRDLTLTLNGLRRIATLIGDILDVARVDQGVFPISEQQLDIVALVQDAAAVLATTGHPIEIKAAQPIVVAADPARLRQCLDNVLANALKHSPADIPVAVHISKERAGAGERARIEIVDQGPGIRPEIISRIFDRFVTGGTRDSGLGLGVYLAKQIALMHGGDLKVSSELGRGARFCVLLPCFDLKDKAKSTNV